MEHKLQSLEITAEEFYHDTNSIYVRLTYVPDQRGYKIAVFNEIDMSKVNDDMIFMASICRGLAEAALQYPRDMADLGKEAMMADANELKSSLSPEDRELLESEPEGNA